MRQWVSVFAVLFVVTLVTTFAIGSIVTIVEATIALQSSIVEIDDLTFASTMEECDAFDAAPCF
jgi:hypothetical protein